MEVRSLRLSRGPLACAYRRFGRVHNVKREKSVRFSPPSATVNLTDDKSCTEPPVVSSHCKRFAGKEEPTAGPQLRHHRDTTQKGRREHFKPTRKAVPCPLRGATFVPMINPPTSSTATTHPDSRGCTERLSGLSFSSEMPDGSHRRANGIRPTRPSPAQYPNSSRSTAGVSSKPWPITASKTSDSGASLLDSVRPPSS
jgi:hypothetical protein